ncbi:hypothetical protein L0B53_03335 [Vibrio sp. SS-MA-C1-2]|uniref:hypothetical protein n=1 Tax=Vibrio sp. SS-MA-C1-2 TaxID=2908646 RepID=UPI001F46C59B|nr:hypothetical protein [Vibrio sp. SS-MA-C1-2]UJF16988.1 hypothetical protein L0B53_03335 [Vibrio sp. SS-MA-C1-2]
MGVENRVIITAEQLLEAIINHKPIDQHYASQESVDNLRERMNEKFLGIDKRFEQVDNRFEQVDKRFEQVEKRFEQVDKQFDKIDLKIERVDKKIDKLLWFIVVAVLTVLFQDYIFTLF